jgi:hypothetical protein
MCLNLNDYRDRAVWIYRHRTLWIRETFFPRGNSSPVGQGHIIEASWSHSGTPHSVGLLWTSDQPITDLNLTTHSTRNRQISMPPPGFEPAIPTSWRSQTHAKDRAATGTSGREILFIWITVRLRYCSFELLFVWVTVLLSYCLFELVFVWVIVRLS